MMIIGDLDIHANTSEKINETDNMWFDSTKLNGCFSCAECCHHENILGSSHGKVPTDSDILPMIFSLECDILAFAHILITIGRESSEVLIDRAFSDIATTWIGNFESAESLEKWWKKKYPDADFLDFLTIESMNTHMLRIESESSIVLEVDFYTERFDDREKCENISNMWNIMKREMFEKESTSNEWKCCIFGTRDFYSASEILRARDFEHLRKEKVPVIL